MSHLEVVWVVRVVREPGVGVGVRVVRELPRRACVSVCVVCGVCERECVRERVCVRDVN